MGQLASALELGADILAVFLLIAGLILVTGATLAGVVRATGAGVAGTGRALRRSGDTLAATVARRPGHRGGPDDGAGRPASLTSRALPDPDLLADRYPAAPGAGHSRADRARHPRGGAAERGRVRR